MSWATDLLASRALSMSALGHKRTSRQVRVMSVIPLKSDIHQRGLHVRLVPLADIRARIADVRFTPESGHASVSADVR